jgi:hypothetical protein
MGFASDIATFAWMLMGLMYLNLTLAVLSSGKLPSATPGYGWSISLPVAFVDPANGFNGMCLGDDISSQLRANSPDD